MKTVEYENLRKLNLSLVDEYQDSFREFLESGWYILGKNVDHFEKQFADYLQTPFTIGVASGLDALLLSLKVFNFPAGSEVIVPSNTYIATILAIMQAGLKPVLVEPDISTYNIDPELIPAKITSRTVAIMVVHLYGRCCEMDKITVLANTNKLQLIEDCAQSHGSAFKGKQAGTFGIGAFSFYPTKNLGALGDAGAITCSDPELNDKFRTLRNYGSKVKYYNEVLGYNSRLDEIQAGFLSRKLLKLDEINSHKNDLANLYQSKLTNAGVIKPLIHPDYYHTYHIYNIRHPKRDELRSFLLNLGIKTEIHYPVSPNHQSALKETLGNQHFPISEEIHATTLSLPISYCHTVEDIEYVIDKINQF